MLVCCVEYNCVQSYATRNDFLGLNTNLLWIGNCKIDTTTKVIKGKCYVIIDWEVVQNTTITIMFYLFVKNIMKCRPVHVILIIAE